MTSYAIRVTKSDIRPPTMRVPNKRLDNNQIGTLDVNIFNVLTLLERLYLDFNKIVTLNIHLFRRLSALKIFEKKSPTEESSVSRYQLYEAMTDVLRLKLKVRESEHIPLSTMQYSVEIKLPKENKLFNGNDVKETCRTMAFRQPIWNETLTFLVNQANFKNRENIKLDLKLSNTDKYKESVKASMTVLCEKDSVEFPAVKKSENSKPVQVHITGKFDAEKDVKCRSINKLCKNEHEFRTKRQEVVFKNMKKKLSKVENLLMVEATPNIAIIGSGGGMRAVIGMCGAMTALQDEGILDSAMYTAGVSGSAWYLLTLYAHDKQLNPKAVNDTIRKNIEPFSTFQLWKALHSWKYYDTKSKNLRNGKYFTVTDTFGETIGDLLLEEKCKQKWSNQRKKLENGSSPLPLLAVLHVRDEKKIKEYNEWIELSPYEVFMPRYGVAIDMKNFGDRFYGGFITKEYGEEPIHFLLGMCGSGYAKVRDLKPTDISGLKQKNKSNKINFWSVIKDNTTSMFNSFDTAFVGKVPNWLHGMSEFIPLFKDLDTSNFTKLIDSTKPEMMLVDAGIAFNSPYPSVLHPARKVEVILSFDFSDRGNDAAWPFEELEKAQKWADERKVSFPKLNLDKIKTEHDKTGEYNEVYKFEGDKETPTIVHFVMINKDFRKQCDNGDDNCLNNQDFDILPTYKTIKFGYSHDEFDKLKSLVEYNVYHNIDKIVKSIQDVVDRKQFNVNNGKVKK